MSGKINKFRKKKNKKKKLVFVPDKKPLISHHRRRRPADRKLRRDVFDYARGARLSSLPGMRILRKFLRERRDNFILNPLLLYIESFPPLKPCPKSQNCATQQSQRL